MASLFSWLDTALTDVANYTGSDKNELVAGIANSVIATATTGKPTIVANSGTATVTGVQPTASTNGLGLNVNTSVDLQKNTLLYVCGAIVVAVLLAVFLPKIIFKKRKKY
ncbi:MULTISPECIES: hypothetical protein [Chitinophagaceae]